MESTDVMVRELLVKPPETTNSDPPAYWACKTTLWLDLINVTLSLFFCLPTSVQNWDISAHANPSRALFRVNELSFLKVSLTLLDTTFWTEQTKVTTSISSSIPPFSSQGDPACSPWVVPPVLKWDGSGLCREGLVTSNLPDVNLVLRDHWGQYFPPCYLISASPNHIYLVLVMKRDNYIEAKRGLPVIS